MDQGFHLCLVMCDIETSFWDSSYVSCCFRLAYLLAQVKPLPWYSYCISIKAYKSSAVTYGSPSIDISVAGGKNLNIHPLQNTQCFLKLKSVTPDLHIFLDGITSVQWLISFSLGRNRFMWCDDIVSRVISVH